MRTRSIDYYSLFSAVSGDGESKQEEIQNFGKLKFSCSIRHFRIRFVVAIYGVQLLGWESTASQSTFPQLYYSFSHYMRLPGSRKNAVAISCVSHFVKFAYPNMHFPAFITWHS